ncbi:MAG: hypothetical protein Q4C14_03855 [Bacillota bacterium]|nr:hypothetical protein [Bacillota bacterium]
MAQPFHLEVVTPEKRLFDGEADMVVVRTVVGDEAYLYDHIYTNAIIGKGLLKIRTADEGMKVAKCEGGFVKVNETGVTVVAKNADWHTQTEE